MVWLERGVGLVWARILVKLLVFDSFLGLEWYFGIFEVWGFDLISACSGVKFGVFWDSCLFVLSDL